ncbi:MAG: hypothetical protein ACHQ17_12405, partial [Polyangia bacterium]|jgi:hypothetical protein
MKRVAIVLSFFLLAACAPKTPEAVADHFVDLYFVVIDQRRALDLTSGLARQKLEEELTLVEKVRTTYDQDQAKPSIFYVRRSSKVMGDHARLTYDITIRQGHDETLRNALVSVERIAGKWTVANFMVREGHLEAAPGTSPTKP